MQDNKIFYDKVIRLIGETAKQVLGGHYLDQHFTQVVEVMTIYLSMLPPAPDSKSFFQEFDWVLDSLQPHEDFFEELMSLRRKVAHLWDAEISYEGHSMSP